MLVTSIQITILLKSRCSNIGNILKYNLRIRELTVICRYLLKVPQNTARVGSVEQKFTILYAWVEEKNIFITV